MRIKRIVAALLAFAITVGIAGNAYAENTGQAMTAEIETAVSDKVQAEAEVSNPEPEQESESKIVRTELTEQNLPDVIDSETAIADGYVARLNSEEQSLSEVVLEKDDGTRALYLFSENVKYIDENGDVADKSNNAVRKGRAFVNEGNDVEIILPATLTAGIVVNSDELNITMKPLTDKNGRSLSPAVKTADDTVVYSDVFDSSTNIEYTYTYGGVKENIILESYNGKNSFDYEITTGGLSLYEDKGTLLLADESGDVKATLGEVVVFSADNKNNTFGKYKVEELEKNNRYKVTVSVDRECLTDPKTKYPVKINPDLKTINASAKIQDLQVFKGTDGKGTSETSAGYSGVSRVGWTDWGACRTLLKLNGFSFSSYGITDVSQIKSAYIEIRDLMCQNIQAQIACAQFGGNVWSEGDTKTWNALNAGSAGTPLDIYIPSKPNETSKAYNVIGDGGESIRSEQGYGKQWYAWNLTGRVKNWLKYPDNLKKGLVFKMAGSMLEESSQYAKCMKTFSSMQGSNADYKPYFVINYNTINDDHNNTMGSATTLKYQIEEKGVINYTNDIDMFKFTAPSDGYYRFESRGSADVKCSLLDKSGKSIASNDDYNIDYDKNFLLRKYLSKDTTVYLKVEKAGGSQNNYKLYVTRSSASIVCGVSKKMDAYTGAVNSYLDTTSAGDSFKLIVNNHYGDTDLLKNKNGNLTTQNGKYKDKITNSDLFIFDGHGGIGKYVTSDDSTILSSSFVDGSFKNNLVSIWTCCQSSKNESGVESLTEASVNAGGKVSIGFENYIHLTDSTEFTENLLKAFYNGATAEQAVQYACTHQKSKKIADFDSRFAALVLTNSANIKICGNRQTKLAPYKTYNSSAVYSSMRANDITVDELDNNENFVKYDVNDLGITYYVRKIDNVETNEVYTYLNSDEILLDSETKFTDNDVAKIKKLTISSDDGIFVKTNTSVSFVERS